MNPRDSGASELIGTILLTGIAVVFAAGFVVLLFTIPGPSDNSHPNIEAFVLPTAPNQVILEHRGGPSLAFASFTPIVMKNGTTFTLPLSTNLCSAGGPYEQCWNVVTSSGVQKSSTRDSFATGDQAIYQWGALYKADVQVEVADSSRNQLAFTPATVLQADTTPPRFLNARTTSTTTIQLNFTEPLGSLDKADFAVTTPVRTISSMILLGNGSAAEITLASAVATDAAPTITAAASPSGTFDVSGNAFLANDAIVSADGIPPTISAAGAAPGASSVTISWTTDELADTQVDYGPTNDAGTLTAGTTTSDTSPRILTPHSVTITGLPAHTQYRYVINTRDANGNLGTASATFTTSSDGGAGTVYPNYFDITATGSLTSGVMSSAFTVNLKSNGGSVSPASSTSLTLATNSSTGYFVNATTGVPQSSFVISTAQNSADFKYVDYRTGGRSIITAFAPNVTAGSTAISITGSSKGIPNHLAFVSPASSVSSGALGTTFTVQLQNVNDSALTAPWDLTLNLATNSSFGRFFDDVGDPVTQITLLQGASATTFSYADNRSDGDSFLMVSTNDSLPASWVVAVNGRSGRGLPDHLQVVPASTTVSGADTITVTLLDANGMVVAPAWPLVLNLSTSSLGGSFKTTGGATPIGAITITSPATSGTFDYYDVGSTTGYATVMVLGNTTLAGSTNLTVTNAGAVAFLGAAQSWTALQTFGANAALSGATITSGTVNAARLPTAAAGVAGIVPSTGLTDAMVASGAAIGYSKLNLAGSIVNADVASGAAIAYSKLNLANSIVTGDIVDGTIANADVSASAAIAYSKLSLANSIVNADVNSAAAIAYSKLNLANSIVTGDIVDGTIANADVSATAAIAYSKLNLAGSIVNADVASGAAIAYSKLNLANSIVTGDIVDGTIVNADINAAAGIVDTKLATISTAGKVSDSALSSNVDLLNAAKSVTGAHTFDAGALLLNPTAGASLPAAVKGTLAYNSTTDAYVVSTSAGNYAKIPLSGSIANADILPAAAIAYSKLNLANSIVTGDIVDGTIANADVNAAAAIAYSKLNLANSIVTGDIVDGTIANADVSASAAIAYSKLSLANSIVNADVNSAAAIAYSKLNLANSIVTGDIVDGTIANADVSASAAIAYSKLNLAGSIVNADVASGAAIADTKLATISTAGKVSDSALSSNVELLNGAQAVSGAKTYALDALVFKGTGTGTGTFRLGHTASAFTITVPAVTDTLAALNTTQTWAAVQDYAVTNLKAEGIVDSNGKLWISTTNTSSSVNYLKVNTAAAGADVQLLPAGADADSDLTFTGKGTGMVKIVDDATISKELAFDLASQTAATTTTLHTNGTAARTINIPDVSGTLLTTPIFASTANAACSQTANTVCTAVATCPAGRVVTGGGGVVSGVQNGAGFVYLYESFPSASNTWTAGSVPRAAAGGTYTLTTWAVCA